jgi:hypothetical protein
MQRAGTTAPRAISRRRRALAPVLLALVTATAACSGGDGEADTTTPPSSTPPPTTPVVTTTEPTTTTVATPPTEPSTTTTTSAPTTQPPSTTGATTTDAVGTAPPTTSTQDRVVAEVVADWQEGWRLFDVAAQAPTDQAAVAAALAYTIDSVFTGTKSYLDGLVANGQRLIPHPDIAASHSILTGPDPIPQTSLEYVMTTCEVSPWIVVDADDPTTVIDDSVITTKWEVSIRFDEGTWKMFGLVPIDDWSGATQCES